MNDHRRTILVLFAALAAIAATMIATHDTANGATAAPAPPTGTVSYVVDGDTIRLTNGRYVRLIGVDTPERGECGFDQAKATLDRVLGPRVGLPNPSAVDDADHYGRLLRYVTGTRGRDAGLLLIRRGLAVARYDSWDGYGWHPREARYREADARFPQSCGVS